MPSFDWSQADLLIKGLCEREWALGVDDLVFMVFLPHFSFSSSSCNWQKECRPIHLSHPLQPLFSLWHERCHKSSSSLKRDCASIAKKNVWKCLHCSVKDENRLLKKHQIFDTTKIDLFQLLSNASILIWTVSDYRDQNNSQWRYNHDNNWNQARPVWLRT